MTDHVEAIEAIDSAIIELTGQRDKINDEIAENRKARAEHVAALGFDPNVRVGYQHERIDPLTIPQRYHPFLTRFVGVVEAHLLEPAVSTDTALCGQRSQVWEEVSFDVRGPGFVELCIGCTRYVP